MIDDPKPLVKALKTQLAALEADLSACASGPEAEAVLRTEWDAARRGGWTSATYESWRSERVTQVAEAWLLATVFLRFAEDNDLLPDRYLSGPVGKAGSARDRICDGFRELCVHRYAEGFMDPERNPLRVLAISADAAETLTKFWRTMKTGRSAVYDFRDPRLDTEFLADLYHDLSDEQRAKYALMETPGFVADFILSRTLAPAIREFGPDDLRVIDPACGSGTFLISAFRSLLAKLKAEVADQSASYLVARSLAAVHGIDKNPIAVAITRFRLMVESRKSLGDARLSESPELRANVAVGDSLLERRAPDAPAWPMSEVGKFSHVRLLEKGSYHVVVGNPPYTTPKDKAESALYREEYSDCVGSYALTVPFMERFFELGLRDADSGRSGYVGMLVSNSFMKREFGRSIVERFFPTVDLTDVIDTAGAFIPGHGSPTVILLGRSQKPHSDTVKAVIGLRGEPSVPVEPAFGRVWQSILNDPVDIQYHDAWTQAVDVNRAELKNFPWTLSGASETEILRMMENGSRLSIRGARIGYFANTGADEIFEAPAASFRRARVEIEPLIKVITGSDVRDWQVASDAEASMFVQGGEGPPLEELPRHSRRLWPYRVVLEQRRNYSGRSYFEDHRLWYGWHHVTQIPDAHPWWIVFSWVSTHNQFAVLRDRAAPMSSAPVIRLPGTASDSDVVQLTALLNSSLAGFWLKHYSNSKGQPAVGQTGSGEPWTVFYEFTATRVGEFPLPPDRWSGDRWSQRADQLDRMARELEETAPSAVLNSDSPSRNLGLDSARALWEKARSRLIGLQEELDWEIYGRYGLTSNADELLVPMEKVPELLPGERAFEIALARDLERGHSETTWFERNGSQSLTELPGHWSAGYRAVVENRIRAIQHSPHVGVVERPEFKRRWTSPLWETLEKEAIRKWLLDRCEERWLWYEPDDDGFRPCLMTAQGLAWKLSGDADFVGMAARYAGEEVDLADVISNLAQTEHVPYLAALRYSEAGLRKYARWTETWSLQRRREETSRPVEIAAPPRYTSADFLKPSYWRLRGKFDVPNERFISYRFAVPDDEQLLGWAGWDHAERARVLTDLIGARHSAKDDSPQPMVPLLAGLRELLFWLRLWHQSPEPPLWEDAPDRGAEQFLSDVQESWGLSEHDLDTWRPPKPKRGRPRKRPR